jgi:regulator of RNase E activity RraA
MAPAALKIALMKLKKIFIGLRRSDRQHSHFCAASRLVAPLSRGSSFSDKVMSQAPSSMSDIRHDFLRVSSELVSKAAELQPALFADVAGRRGALHARIRALAPTMKVCGPAFTVDVRPGDNLMIHAAMAMAKPGDVLVIDGKGDQTSALMGTIMMSACRQIGIAGVVVDGPVRDSAEIVEMGYPVFSAGTNPNGPTKFIPGRIGHPISVGGVAVSPGDLIVGDADGVVVIEREKVENLLPLAAKKFADESKRIAAIKRNEALRPPWLDAALRAAGVLKDGESL